MGADFFAIPSYGCCLWYEEKEQRKSRKKVKGYG